MYVLRSPSSGSYSCSYRHDALAQQLLGTPDCPEKASEDMHAHHTRLLLQPSLFCQGLDLPLHHFQKICRVALSRWRSSPSPKFAFHPQQFNLNIQSWGRALVLLKLPRICSTSEREVLDIAGVHCEARVGIDLELSLGHGGLIAS